MSHTIAKGTVSVACQACAIVDVGSYDEDYRIQFCPLHAAAPELVAALQDLYSVFQELRNVNTAPWLDKANAAIAHAQGTG